MLNADCHNHYIRIKDGSIADFDPLGDDLNTADRSLDVQVTYVITLWVTRSQFSLISPMRVFGPDTPKFPVVSRAPCLSGLELPTIFPLDKFSEPIALLCSLVIHVRELFIHIHHMQLLRGPRLFLGSNVECFFFRSCGCGMSFLFRRLTSIE